MCSGHVFDGQNLKIGIFTIFLKIRKLEFEIEFGIRYDRSV